MRSACDERGGGVRCMPRWVGGAWRVRVRRLGYVGLRAQQLRAGCWMPLGRWMVCVCPRMLERVVLVP